METWTEFLTRKKNECEDEFGIPEEQVKLWRIQWASDIRATCNMRRALPEHVAQSYVRCFGFEAIRDLRGASNAESWHIYRKVEAKEGDYAI